MTNSFQFMASLALAMGLLVGTADVARADYISIDLSSYVNSDLTTYTGGGSYPQHGGSLTIGDVPFTLATIGPGSDTAVLQSNTAYGAGQVWGFNVDQYGVSSAYTLINTAFGTCGTVVGEVDFVGSSSTYTYTLTEGGNVRDHFSGGFCNSLTSGGATEAFGADRLDMQSIELPASFADQTLEAVYFRSYGQGYNGSPFLAAITLDPVGAVPEPAAWPLALATLIALPLARRRWLKQ